MDILMKWLLVQLFYAKVAIESSKEMVQPCNKGKNSTKTMPCWALLVLTISFEIHLAYFFFFFTDIRYCSDFLSYWSLFQYVLITDTILFCDYPIHFVFPFSRRNNESIFDELQSQDTDIIGDVDFGITGITKILVSFWILKF